MTPPSQPSLSPSSLSGLRWWPFVILAAAGAALLLTGGRGGSIVGALALVSALLLLVGFGLAAFLEAMARICMTRQRLAGGFDASPEAARAILDANAGLTRVVNLVLAVFMAMLVFPGGGLPGVSPARTLTLALLCILGLIVWSVWFVKSVHRRLERAGQLGGLEGWNGFIYSNAKDPRLWVPKFSGIGATLNFAHVRAWLILGAILALPLTGVAIALVSVACR